MWTSVKSILKGERTGANFLILAFVWLLVGTLFYGFAPKANLGLGKGFFQAINIGYSIGYGYPEETTGGYLWFSTVYVMIGASFVGLALGFFADRVTSDNAKWFTKMKRAKEYRTVFNGEHSVMDITKAWIREYQAALKPIVAWFVLSWIMVGYSMSGVGWSFTQAVYFAVSALSTGGHWGLPEGSPDWLFPLTAFVAMIGVPLMGVAMGELASLLIDSGDLDITKEKIKSDITGREIKMLQDFGLENGDGVIDKAEFIILSMVRTGQDPELIRFIADTFHELDSDGDNALTVHEITGGSYCMQNGSIRALSASALELGALKPYKPAEEIQADLTLEDVSEEKSTDSGSAAPLPSSKVVGIDTDVAV